MEILEALQALDPTNDEHWTGDGLPATAAVSELRDEKTTRADIEGVAPDFNREFAATTPETQAEPEPVKTRLEQLEDKLADKNTELAALGREMEKFLARKQQLETDIHWLSGQVDRERKLSPGYEQQPIQDYLAGQRKIAQEKAAKRAKLAQSGVAEMLKGAGKAPIDQAMNQRKPARGSARPAPRPLAG